MGKGVVEKGERGEDKEKSLYAACRKYAMSTMNFCGFTDVRYKKAHIVPRPQMTHKKEKKRNER
jgi:hypothetical protein